jgi:transcriptional regulator with XRE-family HTH domain
MHIPGLATMRILMAIDKRIGLTRSLRGLSREAFADLAGISPATISKYELGTAEPTAHMRARIDTVPATMSQTVPALEGGPKIILSPAHRSPSDGKPTSTPQITKGRQVMSQHT